MSLITVLNVLIAAVGGILIASYFFFIVWMAMDAGKNGRFLWLLAILGVPFIGSIVYFFVEKKHDYMRLPEEKEAK